MMNFAGYIRVSKEEPTGGFSLDAQERAIKAWVAGRGGNLVHLYTDESQSGRTTERPAFQEMRRDAAAHKFDALVVNKFDRLHRNRKDSLAFKSLLRYDYGIGVYSVSEPSEETDGDVGMFVEGLVESLAEWYLHNLSEETSKAKRERSRQGYQNNQAPFGMTKDVNKVLIPDENELPGLRMAFGAYATGEYSDADVARMLNEAGYLLRSGNRFSKDTVREMLQSKIYIGKISYRPHRRYEDGREDWRKYEGLEWFDGQHKPVISEALFDKCQEIRASRVPHRMDTSKHKPNLLKGLVYCQRCYDNRPAYLPKPREWGRMRVATTLSGVKNRYFRCMAKEFDVECPQKSVTLPLVESQVIDALGQFEASPEWKAHVTYVLNEVHEENFFRTRLQEIYAMIERVEFEWNLGFIINRDDYVMKRKRLRNWVKESHPEREAQSGEKPFASFAQYWEEANSDFDKQQEIIRLLVKRIYIQGNKISKIDLTGGYTISLV
jgi:DNA invertase Pin-like site-specific DNA recombinase